VNRGIELSPEDDTARFNLLFARDAINKSLGDRAACKEDLEELRRSSTFAVDPTAKCRVLERLAQFHRNSGDRHAEDEAIEALVTLAEVLGDGRWRVASLERLAARDFKLGHYAEAQARYASAAVVKERIGDTLGQAELIAEGGIVAIYCGNLSDALAQLAHASEIAQSNGDLRAMATAAEYTAAVALLRLDFSTCRVSAQQALKRYRRVGNRAREAMTHIWLGLLARRLWSIDEAWTHYNRARELLEPLNMPEYLSSAIGNAGGFANELGRFAQAASFAARARALAEAAGSKRAVAEWAMIAANVANASGRYPLALQICREVLAQQISHREAAGVSATMACAELGLGHFDVSINLLEEGIPKLERYARSWEALNSTVDLARAYLAAARSDDARRCGERLLRNAADAGDAFPPLLRPRILWVSGRAFDATGDSARARLMFERARAALEELRAAIPDAETRDSFSEVPFHREIAAVR
jgi:tetratricopeptide (TPR) repeat protein